MCLAFSLCAVLGSATETGVLTIRSGVELAAAFADPGVHMAVVDTEHLVLSNSDFAAHALPIPLGRNFTVQGVWQHAVGRIPYFDLAYVKGKVQLGPYVFLTFEQLMVRRTRSDPSFRYYCECAAGVAGVLLDICIPPVYVAASIGSLPRPRELPPGNQTLYVNANVTELHPNCTIPVSSFELPFEQQCVNSAGGVYDDLGLECYALNEFGNQVKTGYVSQILTSHYHCYQYMTVECLAQYGGIVGCFNYLMAQQQQQQQANNNSTGSGAGPSTDARSSPPVPPPAAAATVPPQQSVPTRPGAAAGDAADGPTVTAAAASGGGGGGGDGGGNSTAVIVGSVVGGVVGGILLAAGVAVTAILVSRRRRRYASATADARDSKQAGDSESGSSNGSSSCWGKLAGGGAAAAVGAHGHAAAAAGKDRKTAGTHGYYYGNASDTASSSAAQNSAAGNSSNAAASAEAKAPADGGWSAAAALVLVTPLTPLQPHIPLNVTTVSGATASGLTTGSSMQSACHCEHGAHTSNDHHDRILNPAPGESAAAQAAAGSAAAAAAGAGAPADMVVLTSAVLGKGSFGKVVEGLYAGRRVAVKLIDMGMQPPPPQQQPQQNPAQAHEQEPMPQQHDPAQARQGQQGQQQEREQEQGHPRPQQQAEAEAAAAPAHQQSDMRRMQDAIIATMAQEVQVLARVRHPNIVSLLAANLNPPHVCLVMERMDTSLDRLLYKQPDRPFPLSLVVHIALQVARALEYLHPTIVHRDLKPGNVLISLGGGGGDASSLPLHEQAVVAKLADFGLSRLRATVLVTKNPEVGTGPYMAPECFDVNATAITDRADCYSFGVLLWELIARRHPWAELTMMQMAVQVVMGGVRLPMLPLARAGASPKLQRLILQCFDADPRRRPAAAEIVKQLLLVQQRLGPGSRG
ncbi:hypothetical protein HXX76_010500 [Chlamydomonas incerta]|uniref:Protein kinase domain-containing protein n=1 Tax=Chlamydomonas incerta TaxID=51695 RepID=A0A835SWZ7_CHLIN|nr:hypothetical protein HXX76_010500 [Chlamydomonas incerta]|eukprot:KAG2428355.1 hypothetical protein HXX76_010500 [Chlamydomonas incerta]